MQMIRTQSLTPRDPSGLLAINYLVSVINDKNSREAKTSNPRTEPTLASATAVETVNVLPEPRNTRSASATISRPIYSNYIYLIMKMNTLSVRIYEKQQQASTPR